MKWATSCTTTRWETDRATEARANTHAPAEFAGTNWWTRLFHLGGTAGANRLMKAHVGRIVKIVAACIGCLFALLLVACFAVYFYIQANGLKQLTERGSAALGRPI